MRPKLLLALLALAAAAALALLVLLLRGGAAVSVEPAHAALAPTANGRGAGALGPSTGEGDEAAASRASGRAGLVADAALEDESNSPAAGEADVPHLVGRVLAPSGEPVADARVLLRESPFWMSVPADLEPIESLPGSTKRRAVRTDPEGRFVFDSIEPGDWSLGVRASGMAPFDRERLRVPRHQLYDLGELRLAPGIVLEGRAIDASGAGVAGVQVLRAVSPEGGSLRFATPGFGAPLTETDAEGRFRIDCLAPGSWHLIFDSPRHRVAELKGSDARAGAVRRDLVVRLDAGLPIAGRVEGEPPSVDSPLRVSAHVTKEQPGTAAEVLEGAERHRPRRADVAADGSFRLLGLAPGVQYRVSAERWEASEAGAQDENASPTEPEGSWKSVHGIESQLAMAGASELVLRRAPAASVALRAVDATTRAPVTRYAVTLASGKLQGGGLLEAGGAASLDHPDGRARFDALRAPEEGAGAHLLVQAPGYAPLETPEFLLRAGEAKDAGELALTPAPGLAVRVVEAEGGAPVEGARVVLARASDAEMLERFVDPANEAEPWSEARVRFASTDGEGRARVEAFADEVCVVRAVARDHVASDALRSLPPHSSPTGSDALEIPLARAGSVRVTVHDPRGKPISGIYVEHQSDADSNRSRYRWDPSEQARQTSDESGVVLFEGLSPGEHRFRALEGGPQMRFGRAGPAEDDSAPKAEVRIAAGESVDVELELRARGGYRAVLLQAGKPLAGALATLRDPNAPNARNRGGFFRPGGQDPTRALADSEGRVAFQGLATGWYELEVGHPERRMSSVFDVEVVADPVEQRLELGTPTIEGRVVGERGEPLAGIAVDVSTTRKEDDGLFEDVRISVTEGERGDMEFDMESVAQRTIETDAEGRYELVGVRSGEELNVRVHADLVVGDARTIPQLSRDEVRRGVDFRLAAAGRIRLDVTGMDRSGRERYSVALALQAEEGRGQREQARLQPWRTRRDFNALRPGTWTVELWKGDERDRAAKAEVVVTAGETRTLTLAVP